MKKQSLIKGSLVLGIAGIFSRFLGLFFRWPLIMMIGDLGVGYYQMSYPLYMFFIAFASGMPIAVSKIVAERLAVNDIEGAFEAKKTSMKFMIVLGASMSCLLLLGAPYIVKVLKWDPNSYYSLIGISIAPIAVSIMFVLRGFFQGFQNMNYTAISEILEQIGRVVIGVGLAFLLLKKGIQYAAGGAAFGAAAGGFFGSAYLFYKYNKVKKSYNIKKIKNNENMMNRFAEIALPISIGASVGSIMSLIDSILVPQKLLQAGYDFKASAILYAQLTGKANVLINVPMTLSVAIGMSLIPIISASNKINDYKEVNNKIGLSLKLSSLIALPCFLGFFFMSEPIMKLIFPGRYDGFTILKYLSISIPFIILTQTTTSILQSIDHLKAPILNMGIGCIVKVVLTIILVPKSNINIYGAVIASIFAYVVASLLNVIYLYMKTQYRININDLIIKPSICSIVMIMGVVTAYYCLLGCTRSNALSCLISIFVGIIIYLLLLFSLKIVDFDMIKDRIIKR